MNNDIAAHRPQPRLRGLVQNSDVKRSDEILAQISTARSPQCWSTAPRLWNSYRGSGDHGGLTADDVKMRVLSDFAHRARRHQLHHGGQRSGPPGARLLELLGERGAREVARGVGASVAVMT